MNLNKNQIEALARKISDKKQNENKKIYDKELSDFLKNAKNKAEAKRIVKLLSQVPSYIIPYYAKYTEKIVLDKMAYDKLGCMKYTNIRDIINNITIASIDSKDIDELSKKLNIKF